MKHEYEHLKSPEFFEQLNRHELAYWLGFVTGGAHVDFNSSYIVSNKNSEIFPVISQHLFSVPVNRGSGINRSQYLNSKEIVNFVGDFSRYEWPETIQEKHPWIVQNKQNIIWFLTGAFDGNGNISHPDVRSRGQSIVIASPSPEGICLMLQMTKIIGTPFREKKKKDAKKGLGGIWTSDIQTLNSFAQIVHSLDIFKEEILSMYRGPIEKVAVCDMQILQAYDFVMGLRQQGLFPSQIYELTPKKLKEHLSRQKIEDWVHSGKSPYNNKRNFRHKVIQEGIFQQATIVRWLDYLKSGLTWSEIESIAKNS